MKKQISISISEIARLIDGVVTGNGDLAVRGVQGPGGTDPEQVVICRDAREVSGISSGVPVIAVHGKIPEGHTGIEVPDPQKAFVRVLEIFSEDRSPSPGVHDTAVVGESTDLSPSCSVGPLCVICDGAVIGDHAVLEAQVYVGPDVVIGPGTRIEANTVLREGTIVGEDCLIHSGTVIGCDGFGFIPDLDGGHRKIPQLGRVKIGDRVEIGACVTIDRATVDDTVIGEGTVIDNHVHIGHNARIGKNCILVAMTGIAGSSVLEDGVVMAARSGASDHVTIGKKAQVAANAGAMKDVPPGAIVSGFPARDHREQMKIQALIARLPGMREEIRKLKKEIADLKTRGGHCEGPENKE
ncbi:MAG: UDP-3-O-(3-hydroxymyristoyl)glucosamine N-acyltransferase [Synergistota bacterium]|nr:UDP-3-O-(3-hydroxymyristoyl)glucosamine N-acyltransferase [Synergistota bacterium]